MLSAHAQPGPALFDVIVPVRLVSRAPASDLPAVRAALTSLPSVRSVLPARPAEAAFSMRVASLLSFLAELGTAPALAHAAVVWHATTGLVVDISPPPAAGRRRGARRLWLGVAALSAIAVTATLIQRTDATDRAVSPPAPGVVEAPAAPLPPRSWQWERDREGGCLTPGGTACDGVTHALWQGDANAWSALAAREGWPAPSSAEVIAATRALRLSAGDLATRLATATAGQPVLAIEAASVTLADGRYALDLTLANLGGGESRIDGVQIVDEGGAVWLTLPRDARLAPDERCHLSTSVSTDPCHGAGAVTPGRTGALPGVLIVRAGDGSELDRFVLPK